MDVDHRQPDRHVADAALDRREHVAGAERDVGRRPAHVEGQDVVEAGARGSVERADDAGRGSGEHERRTVARSLGRVDDPSVRLHHLELGVDPPGGLFDVPV